MSKAKQTDDSMQFSYGLQDATNKIEPTNPYNSKYLEGYHEGLNSILEDVEATIQEFILEYGHHIKE